MNKKERIDQILVERQLAPSRQKAQALILSGNVLVNDVPVDKPGQKIDLGSEIRIRGEGLKYVSRGGLKLEKALDEFGVTVENRVAIDVGASTGGFTDVLLQRGVKVVHAVDVGKNQLDWKIRSDERVKVQEGLNVRYLEFDQIGEFVDMVVIDVSFISLKLIVPAVLNVVKEETDWIALIKPQFEVGKDEVEKGGVIRTESKREAAVESVIEFARSHGLISQGLIKSPITGAQGNIEYLVHWRKESS